MIYLYHRINKQLRLTNEEGYIINRNGLKSQKNYYFTMNYFNYFNSNFDVSLFFFQS